MTNTSKSYNTHRPLNTRAYLNNLPKTVETKVERQKLMFRVKARIAPELLKKYIEYVKTGLPGVAWVQINPEKPWPAHLQLKGAEKK